MNDVWKPIETDPLVKRYCGRLWMQPGKTVQSARTFSTCKQSAPPLPAQVQGMLLMENGEIADEIPDPEDWPYQTVLEAVRDGWRVVQFPNLALLLDETRTYGLGCEFILER